MSMPLEGIRIVDWTIFQQGPVATAMLADLGADVIKIEARGRGDPGRHTIAAHGGDRDRPNFYFEANNRNKKSLALDLKRPEAVAIVQKLVARSDVFVQNFRKGVAGRLGLDYASLRAHNAQLIYASATGYGPHGPDSGEPSYDILGLARSGFMFASGEPDMPPLDLAGACADQMGAFTLAYGVLAALMARERFGVGQEVDASLLGGMMMFQGLSVSARGMAGKALSRMYRSDSGAGNPLWNRYRCQDDKWLCLGMVQPEGFWENLCDAIGRSELAADERFATTEVRRQNSAAAVAELDAVFASKPRDEWMKILREHPGGFIFTLINSVNDLPDDPQVKANDYVIDVEHPRYGTIQMLGMPVRLGETPGQVRSPAPELGQHSEEVLLDLGYDSNAINELRKQQVI